MISAPFFLTHLLLAYPSLGVQMMDSQYSSSIDPSGSITPNALMRTQREDLDEVVIGGQPDFFKTDKPDLPDEDGALEKPDLPDEDGTEEKKSSTDTKAKSSGAKKVIKKLADNMKDTEADSSELGSSGNRCAVLKSKGTYYTVDLQVGTPGQTFAVVADTGSDAVIVPSCVCTESGSCNKKDRCFRGTNKSTTFSIMGMNKSTGDHPKLPVINMFFGSGEIRAIVASDMVNVGGVKSLMKNSVMLMVDQALRIQGTFEGILGLGPPKGNHTDFKLLQKKMPGGEIQNGKGQQGSHHGSTVNPFDPHHGITTHTHVISPNGNIHSGHSPMGAMNDAIQKILKDAMARHSSSFEDAVGDIVRQHPSALQQLSVDRDDYWPFGIPKPKKNEHFQPLGFDYASNVTGFSMCFNDMGADGALHLDVPKAENSLLSIGKEHWGVDFRGISVGDDSESASVKFCGPEDKTEGARTACGAIPDSGTTLFMAPMAHVEKLFGQVCDNWDRCKKAVSTGLEHEKLQIFQMLLHECSAWVGKNGNKNTTLHELPDLHFHLAGKDGKAQKISLTGDDYIIETMEDEVEMVTRNIFGMPIKIPQKTGKMKKVCAPAFSSMEMQTKDNGKVWILGAPLFYKYTVAYDNDAKNPSIAFNKHESCGCPKAKKSGSLVSSAQTPSSGGMRELHAPPRLPSFALQKDFRL